MNVHKTLPIPVAGGRERKHGTDVRIVPSKQ